MKEFVLIKNEDGSGELLLRVASIVTVEDFTGAGGEVRQGRAYVVYQDSNDVGQRRHIRTDSTAAEVLAAIEGAQDSAPILRGPNGGAWIQTSYNSISPVDLEDYRSSPNFLALTALANQLAMELENQTGVRWGLSIQRLENSVAFFRCSPAKSTQHFDTKTFCHVALEDESGEALAKMAQEMAMMVLASWRLRGL